jgi:Domain of unknown function (DUF5679)
LLDKIKEKRAILIYSSKDIYYILATQAYCVKCKSKRDMNDEKQVTMKNGRQAISGTCIVCGTKMFKIGGGGGGARRTAIARPRVKAASKKKTAKKRTVKVKTKAKINRRKK